MDQCIQYLVSSGESGGANGRTQVCIHSSIVLARSTAVRSCESVLPSLVHRASLGILAAPTELAKQRQRPRKKGDITSILHLTAATSTTVYLKSKFPSYTVYQLLASDLALLHVLQALRDRRKAAFPELKRVGLDRPRTDECRHFRQELRQLRAVLGRGGDAVAQLEFLPKRSVDEGVWR